MRHGSLFSGIRGFELAAHWMGWENIFSCEIDEFCNKVGRRHFPETIIHTDIKQTNFITYANRIDILTGGFPCQPYSVAGKRKGKHDVRHLWPEMLRAIKEIAPCWVVGENVRGLINWNGGVVFNEVQSDLEAAGYEVLPFLLPACAINAPHRRDRIWFIAHTKSVKGNLSKGSKGECSIYTNGNGTEGITSNSEVVGRKRSGHPRERRTGFEDNDLLNEYPNGSGREEQHAPDFAAKSEFCNWGSIEDWSNWPTQPPVCGRNDGIPNRMDRIKALGNAIVPQVALQIFKAIEQYEKLQ
jgi:DNA (cytosine-5)-methyltransferase 1